MKTTDNPIKDVMSKASAAGYSMADVCRVAEIDQSQASRWLSGRTKPLYASVVRLNQVVDAMRAVAPSIQVVAVGNVGRWDEQMLRDCADHMDLISEHFYCRDRKDLAQHVAQIPDNVKRIADAHRKYRQTIPGLAGKNLRIALDEWNFWYGPYVFGELGTRYFLKDGLGIAAGLHEYFRNSDIIFMANYAQTVNVIGAIKTSKTAAQFETTGQVLKMYRNHYGEIPVEISGTSKPLDVAAAWTADRKALTIAVVNPTRTEVELPIAVKGATISGEGRVWCVTGPDEMAYNDPGKEPAVPITEATVPIPAGKLKVAPLSATVYRFPAGSAAKGSGL